jgi:uncharacterized protein YecE (DUF72 family)
VAARTWSKGVTKRGLVRAGIGGWTFEPWEGTFYPDGLPKKRQLEYASRQLATIEVNGTYYSTFKPDTFAKWAAATPDDFVFSLKANRFATNRRVLAEAGDSIKRFLDSGPTMLGSRLGPILWQFAPTKKFDSSDFGAFLELLPDRFDGQPLRHAVEVRHPSFVSPDFVALIRRFGVAVVYADHPTYPAIADLSGNFVYARLQKGDDEIATGYPPAGIAAWAAAANTWAEGGVPEALASQLAAQAKSADKQPRDVFVYFIHGGKVRAPAAAQALMAALGRAAAPPSPKKPSKPPQK